MIYQVVNNQGEHEYNLSIDKQGDTTKFILSYSDADMYLDSNKGEPCLIVDDNGNGLYIHKYIKTDRGNLRYDEATALFIVLSYINSVDKLFEGKVGTFDIKVQI